MIVSHTPFRNIMDAFRLPGVNAMTSVMGSLTTWFARIVRLSAALMLVAILAHATIPLGAPFEQHSGSAFSATTSETTIDIGRSPQVRKTLPAKLPGGDPDTVLPTLLLVFCIVLVSSIASVRVGRFVVSELDMVPRRLRPNIGPQAPPIIS